MNPKERINKPNYKNWIKGTLSLIHVCEVVKTYAVHVFDKFLDTVPDRVHFDSGYSFKEIAEHALWDKKNKIWKYSTQNTQNTQQCLCCQFLFPEIIRLYYKKGEAAKHIGFQNCIDRQVGGAWGLAKFFMPIDKYSEAVENPEDTDVPAVFKMIMNCELFKHISHADIEHIIEGRNKMMHSPQNSLTASELAKYIDAMVNFLSDAITPQLDAKIYQKLKKSYGEILELKRSDMTVGLLHENAERAIQFKKKIVVGNIKRGYEEGDVTELSKYLDMLEELGGDLLAWNKCSWEMGEQRQLLVYREQLERSNNEKEVAEKSLKEAKSKLENANIEIKRLKKELNEANSDLAEAKSNLAAAILEMGNLTKMLDETQERLNLSKIENEILKQELLGKQLELTTVKSENDNLQEMIQNMQVQMQQPNEKLTSTANELTLAINENETLKNKLQDSKKQLKSVQKEKEDFCKELRNTQEQLIAANAKLFNISTQFRDVQEQLEKAINDKRNISKDLNETKDNMLLMLMLGLTPFLDNFLVGI